MTIKNQLELLAAKKGSPCITISFNTHRTFPENAQDEIVLKNLLHEAEKRVITEFGKRETIAIVEKLSSVTREMDNNYNLNSMHIFISEDTQEIIKSALPASENMVHISDTFALRPIIKDYFRSHEYLILLVSQGGVNLYKALNEHIVSEYNNDDFPVPEMAHNINESYNSSDSKLLDDIVREYLNKVDKSIVDIFNKTDLKCVVISNGDNYSKLLQVADRPDIYCGHATFDNNKKTTDQLVNQSWEIISKFQFEKRSKEIDAMFEAVGKGNVYTDIHEIYSAAIDGRGELLIIHEDFVQPVLMTGERTFDLITDSTTFNAIDDITSNIAWEVFSKKGKVVFTSQDKIKEIGNIVLKTRY